MANTPNLQFYKGPTSSRPADANKGSIFFDTSKRTINVKVNTGNTDDAWEAYSGVQSLSYTDQKLTWVDAKGQSNTLTFADVASKTAFEDFVTKTNTTFSVLETTLEGLKDDVADITLDITTVKVQLASVSDYINSDIKSSIAAEVTARISADTSLATSISDVSKAISGLDATLSVGAGEMISVLKQADGKVSIDGTKVVMDGLVVSFNVTNNKLTIANAANNATLSQVVDLSILAQDKYVSSVEYLSDTKVLQFTWIEKDGKTTQAVTVPVGDLVDTYTAGSGIVINDNKISLSDDTLQLLLREDYITSVDNTTTTAKSVRFAVTSGKITGTVQGVDSSTDVNSKISTALVTAAASAQTYASSALVAAKEYTSAEVAALETTLKTYAQALVTWAVFA